MKKLYLYVFCAYCFLSSCGANIDKNTSNQKTILTEQASKKETTYFEHGKIISKIHCLADTNISFALYLPKSIDTTKKLPVIYFYDPDGAGKFPLDKYKKLADKYNYILIGSNDSKNGLQLNKYDYITKILFNDTKNRLNINGNRVYTAGFSGGARVAVDVALKDPSVSGVAGCGAGFPQVTGQINPVFTYISFAGSADFNLSELKVLDQQLNGLSLRHFLIEFNGGHEWPGEIVFENAFYGFEFDAMQKTMVPKNEKLIASFIQQNDSIIKHTIAKNQYYNTYSYYRKMIFFLNQLAAIKNYHTELLALQNTAAFKRVLEEKSQIENQEAELEKYYVDAFKQQNLSWWTDEIKKMNKQPETEKGFMYKRLKSYLGLIVYMEATAALNQNDTKAVVKLLNIYKLLEPKNTEHAYLFAVFYAKNGETQNALLALQEAKQLGFKDVKRIVADKTFKNLEQNADFKELISQLYSRQK